MLENRTFIVTGGAGALGRAVVERFAGSGARVAVADLEAALADAELPDGAFAAPVDLLDEEDVRRMVGEVVAQEGRIDGLVCLAGGFFGGQDVATTPLAQVRRQHELNVMTAYATIQAALPAMLDAGGGSIACISSRPAIRTEKNSSAYAMAKGAVLKLVQVVDEEYRQRGIRANVILPSIIDTPANRRDMPKANFDTWVQPADIAAVLQYLASAEGRIVSGATIPVFGNA